MLKTVEPILLFKRLSKTFGILTFLTLASCTTVYPNVDLVLAREAFNSATEVDAAKYSPINYHKAEEAYRKAMVSYTSHNYEEAIEGFRVARIYAERAENSSRAQRQKSGEEAL